MFRREFLGLVGTGVGLALVDSFAVPTRLDDSAVDATLHISPIEVEIASRRTVKTTAYN